MKQSECVSSLLEYLKFKACIKLVPLYLISPTQLNALLSLVLCQLFLGLLHLGQAELHSLVSNL
jgi:hypothetical protein